MRVVLYALVALLLAAWLNASVTHATILEKGLSFVISLATIGFGAHVAQRVADRYKSRQTKTEIRRQTLVDYTEGFWAALDAAMEFSGRKYRERDSRLVVDPDVRVEMNSEFIRCHRRLRALSIRIMFFENSTALKKHHDRMMDHLEWLTNVPRDDVQKTQHSWYAFSTARYAHDLAATKSFTNLAAIMVNEVEPGTIVDRAPWLQRVKVRLTQRPDEAERS